MLTIEIPDDIASALGLAGPDAKHKCLELLALGGYTAQLLSHGQVRKLLGFGFHEAEEFLKRMGAPSHLTVEDVLEQVAYLNKMIDGTAPTASTK